MERVAINVIKFLTLMFIGSLVASFVVTIIIWNQANKRAEEVCVALSRIVSDEGCLNEDVLTKFISTTTFRENKFITFDLFSPTDTSSFISVGSDLRGVNGKQVASNNLYNKQNESYLNHVSLGNMMYVTVAVHIHINYPLDLIKKGVSLDRYLYSTVPVISSRYFKGDEG